MYGFFFGNNFDASYLSLAFEDENGSEFDLLVQSYLRQRHYTSSRQAVINLIYVMINVTVVTLPAITKFLGIPLFIISVISLSILSSYSSKIIVDLANENGMRTIEDLAQKVYGDWGFVISCSLQLFISFTFICLTLNVSTDIVSNILSYFITPSLTHYRLQIIIASLGAFLMCCSCFFVRSIASLNWLSTSMAILVAICLISVSVSFINKPDYIESGRNFYQPKPFWWVAGIFLSGLYSHHQKLFMVYGSLRRRTPTKWIPINIWAHTAITILYLIFGILGYISTLENTSTEELMSSSNYFMHLAEWANGQAFMSIAGCLFALCLLFSSPLDCLVVLTLSQRLSQRIITSQRRKQILTSWNIVLRSFSLDTWKSNRNHENNRKDDYDSVYSNNNNNLNASLKSTDRNTEHDSFVHQNTIDNDHHILKSTDEYERLPTSDEQNASFQYQNQLETEPNLSGKPAQHQHVTRSPSPERTGSEFRKRDPDQQQLKTKPHSDLTWHQTVSDENNNRLPTSSVAEQTAMSSKVTTIDLSQPTSTQSSQNSPVKLHSHMSHREGFSNNHGIIQVTPSRKRRESHPTLTYEDLHAEHTPESSVSNSQNRPIQPVIQALWNSTLLETFTDYSSERESDYPHNNVNGATTYLPLNHSSHSEQQVLRFSQEFGIHGDNINSIPDLRSNVIDLKSSNCQGVGDDVNYFENTSDNMSDPISATRQLSLGYIMEQQPTTSCWGKIPTMIVWVCALAVTVSIPVTDAMKSLTLFGIVLSVAITFLAPGILYFKLGLASDFQAIPNVFRSVPNQLRMKFIMFFGAFLLATNIFVYIYSMIVYDTTIFI